MMNKSEYPMVDVVDPLRVSTMWALLFAVACVLSFVMFSREKAMAHAENVMFEEYQNWVFYTDTSEQDYLNSKFQVCLLTKNIESIENLENYEPWLLFGTRANPYKFFELAEFNKERCVLELRHEAESLEITKPGFVNEYKQFVSGLNHRYRWKV